MEKEECLGCEMGYAKAGRWESVGFVAPTTCACVVQRSRATSLAFPFPLGENH